MHIAWLYAGIGLVLSMAGIRSAIRHRTCVWTLKPDARGKVSSAGLLVGADAMLVVLTSAALTALGGVLARTHVPGIADRGMESITGLNSAWHIGSATWFQELPIRWHDWQIGTGKLLFDRPAHVLGAYLALDSIVFVPAYALLLSYLIARLIEKSGRYVEGGREPWRWVAWLMARPSCPTTRTRMSQVEFPMYALLILAVVADLLENVFVATRLVVPLAENRLPVWNPVPLQVLVSVKLFGLVAVVAFGIVPSALVVLEKARSSGRLPGLVVGRLRGLLVVLGLFGLLITLRGFQAPDSIRRWSPAQGVFTAVVVAVFGVVLAWSAYRLLRARRTNLDAIKTYQLGIGLAGVVGVGVVGLILGHAPKGLILPGVALFLLWVFNSNLDKTRAGKRMEGTVSDVPRSLGPLLDRPGALALPALLAIGPLFFLALAAARATIPQTVFNHPEDYSLQRLVIFLSVIVPAVALAEWWVFVRWALARYGPGVAGAAGKTSSSLVRTLIARWWRAALLILGAGYVWWRVISAPWSFPQAMGTVVIVALFLLFVALFVAWLSRLQVHHAPPLSLRVFGFRQLPVFLILLVWIVLAIPFARTDYHDVRLIEVSQPVAQVAPTDAVDRWFEGSQPDGRMHPMVFVTANGGGIKAAVWAAMVLDCVLGDGSAIKKSDVHDYCSQFNSGDVDRWSSSVFVASGVSGGTLGLVTYDRLRASDPDHWLRTDLGDDFVSPSMAWQTFIEAPQSYLQFENADDMDRAEVLERAWERADLQRSAATQLADALWRGDDRYADVLGDPLLSAEGAEPQPPYLIFNGSTVEDGCRLETSSIRFTTPEGSLNCTGVTRLDTHPADAAEAATVTRDLFPFLCDTAGTPQDVRASTAVTLAARFPVVSPSGRLVSCPEDPDDATHVHIVDGGYGDNSGGAAVAALWNAISPEVDDQIRTTDPCAVPVLLEIDSGYGPTPQSRRSDVPELTAPLVGVGSAREIRTIEGRDMAALAFRRPFGNVLPSLDRQAIVYLRSNPEGEATLGWTMDDSTFDQMEAQLVSNADELQTVSHWFDEPCPQSATRGTKA